MTRNIKSPPQVRLLPADYSIETKQTPLDIARVLNFPKAKPCPNGLRHRKKQNGANEFLKIGIDRFRDKRYFIRR